MHHFMLAQRVLQEQPELVQREWRRAVLELDEGLGMLPTIRVGDADHDDLGNRRMPVDGFLDGAWVDVEAAAQQHVLDAVGDGESAVVVHAADVAGAEVAIGRHRLGARLRLFPVAAQHIGPGHADLAALAVGHVPLRVIDVEEADVDAAQRYSASAGRADGAARRDGADAAHFRHAPALLHRVPGHPAKALAHLGRQGRAAGIAEAQRAQVGLVQAGAGIQRGEHGGHAEEHRHPLVGNLGDGALGLEAQVQHAFGRQPHCHQQVEGQRVDMEQRQHAQKNFLAGTQAIVAAGVHHCLAGGGRQVAMGKHRALRQAGGAAGVLEDRDCGIDIDGGRRHGHGIAGGQVLEADARRVEDDVGDPFGRSGHFTACHLRQIAHHQAAQAGAAQHLVHQRVQRGQVQRHHDVGLAVGNLVPDHIRGVERRIIDDGAAGFQDCE
jgi:hypothetical protein